MVLGSICNHVDILKILSIRKLTFLSYTPFVFNQPVSYLIYSKLPQMFTFAKMTLYLLSVFVLLVASVTQSNAEDNKNDEMINNMLEQIRTIATDGERNARIENLVRSIGEVVKGELYAHSKINNIIQTFNSTGGMLTVESALQIELLKNQVKDQWIYALQKYTRGQTDRQFDPISLGLIISSIAIAIFGPAAVGTALAVALG